jgi:hydroxymethylbilane synthase
MDKIIRIGTRESQLAVWQATLVQQMLAKVDVRSELVYIKSEGDIDLQTPLYEMGVQGIFTRSLDIALLNDRIDLAVHSLKDVPTQMPEGIVRAATLKRGSYKDLLVYKGDVPNLLTKKAPLTIATSSIRRKAQWLNRYPDHIMENLRGNVNTRLKKLEDSEWHGAIFAAAGLERINLRPAQSIELDWMLPAPAQGAITVACRKGDCDTIAKVAMLNDEITDLCTNIERDFLRALLGGCSTPISALAVIEDSQIIFRGNIMSLDGKERVDIEKIIKVSENAGAGKRFAEELLAGGGQAIADKIRNAGE